MKELRIENVSGMDAGNVFLQGFVSRSNERFAVRPAKTHDLHQELRLKPDRLKDILCHREQRHVGDQLTLAYDRKQLILERSAVSEEMGAQYVDIYDFPDGRLEVRWKGHVLPTASSIKTSESTQQPLSRTRDSVMRCRSSRPSKIRGKLRR